MAAFARSAASSPSRRSGQKGQSGQYSASKAGDIGFHQGVAENARNGITVNGSGPGYINTEMVQAARTLEKNVLPQMPVNRLGEPEEIARRVFLRGRCRLLHGLTMTVNGGQYHA